MREVRAAERRGEGWEQAFPTLAQRARDDRWFDYATEDGFIAGR